MQQRAVNSVLRAMSSGLRLLHRFRYNAEARVLVHISTFFSVLLLSLPAMRSQTADSIVITARAQYFLPVPAVPLTPRFDRQGRPYLYLAAKDAGLIVFDVSAPTTTAPVDTVTTAALGGLHVMDVVQEGALLFVPLGNFFGSPGQAPGLAIIDVSDPRHPFVAGLWLSDSADKGAAAVSVQGRYAYLGAMTQGVIVLDVADPSNPSFVSRFLPDPNFPKVNPGLTERPNARGMAISDTLLFLCYDAGGLRVLNISDPQHLSEIGRYLNPGVIGKQQAYNTVTLSTNAAFVGIDYCGMEVLDISNPRNILQKGWWNPWQCQLATSMWNGSPGHVNQVVQDSASGLLFLSSGASQVCILDVSVPALPRKIGGYGSPGDKQGVYSMTKAGIHNMSKALARECGQFGIRVNTLVPGLTRTKFAMALHDDEEFMAKQMPHTPLARGADPSEMAGAVLYLVSDAASYTTGSSIVIDGGYLA